MTESWRRSVPLEGLPDVDVDELVRNADAGIASAEGLRGKNVVMFLGKSGQGKSLTLHLVADIAIEAVRVQAANPAFGRTTYQPKDEIPGSRVGHEQVSETRLISWIKPTVALHGDTVFVDTPGFIDTNGPVVDVPNSFAIGRVFEVASSIVPVLFFSSAAILDARGFDGPLHHVLRQFMRLFRPDQLREVLLRNSIVVVICASNKLGSSDQQVVEEVYAVLQGLHDAIVQKSGSLAPELELISHMIGLCSFYGSSKIIPPEAQRRLVFVGDPTVPHLGSRLRSVFALPEPIRQPSHVMCCSLSERSLKWVRSEADRLQLAVSMLISSPSEYDLLAKMLSQLVRLSGVVRIDEVSRARESSVKRVAELAQTLAGSVETELRAGRGLRPSDLHDALKRLEALEHELYDVDDVPRRALRPELPEALFPATLQRVHSWLTEQSDGLLPVEGDGVLVASVSEFGTFCTHVAALAVKDERFQPAVARLGHRIHTWYAAVKNGFAGLLRRGEHEKVCAVLDMLRLIPSSVTDIVLARTPATASGSLAVSASLDQSWKPRSALKFAPNTTGGGGAPDSRPSVYLSQLDVLLRHLQRTVDLIRQQLCLAKSQSSSESVAPEPLSAAAAALSASAEDEPHEVDFDVLDVSAVKRHVDELRRYATSGAARQHLGRWSDKDFWPLMQEIRQVVGRCFDKIGRLEKPYSALPRLQKQAFFLFQVQAGDETQTPPLPVHVVAAIKARLEDIRSHIHTACESVSATTQQSEFSDILTSAFGDVLLLAELDEDLSADTLARCYAAIARIAAGVSARFEEELFDFQPERNVRLNMQPLLKLALLTRPLLLALPSSERVSWSRFERIIAEKEAQLARINSDAQAAAVSALISCSSEETVHQMRFEQLANVLDSMKHVLKRSARLQDLAGTLKSHVAKIEQLVRTTMQDALDYVQSAAKAELGELPDPAKLQHAVRVLVEIAKASGVLSSSQLGLTAGQFQGVFAELQTVRSNAEQHAQLLLAEQKFSEAHAFAMNMKRFSAVDLLLDGAASLNVASLGFDSLGTQLVGQIQTGRKDLQSDVAAMIRGRQYDEAVSGMDRLSGSEQISDRRAYLNISKDLLSIVASDVQKASDLVETYLSRREAPLLHELVQVGASVVRAVKLASSLMPAEQVHNLEAKGDALRQRLVEFQRTMAADAKLLLSRRDVCNLLKSIYVDTPEVLKALQTVDHSIDRQVLLEASESGRKLFADGGFWDSLMKLPSRHRLRSMVDVLDKLSDQGIHPGISQKAEDLHADLQQRVQSFVADRLDRVIKGTKSDDRKGEVFCESVRQLGDRLSLHHIVFDRLSEAETVLKRRRARWTELLDEILSNKYNEMPPNNMCASISADVKQLFILMQAAAVQDLDASFDRIRACVPHEPLWWQKFDSPQLLAVATARLCAFVVVLGPSASGAGESLAISVDEVVKRAKYAATALKEAIVNANSDRWRTLQPLAQANDLECAALIAKDADAIAKSFDRFALHAAAEAVLRSAGAEFVINGKTCGEIDAVLLDCIGCLQDAARTLVDKFVADAAKRSSFADTLNAIAANVDRNVVSLGRVRVIASRSEGPELTVRSLFALKLCSELEGAVDQAEDSVRSALAMAEKGADAAGPGIHEVAGSLLESWMLVHQVQVSLRHPELVSAVSGLKLKIDSSISRLVDELRQMVLSAWTGNNAGHSDSLERFSKSFTVVEAIEKKCDTIPVIKRLQSASLLQHVDGELKKAYLDPQVPEQPAAVARIFSRTRQLLDAVPRLSHIVVGVEDKLLDRLHAERGDAFLRQLREAMLAAGQLGLEFIHDHAQFMAEQLIEMKKMTATVTVDVAIERLQLYESAISAEEIADAKSRLRAAYEDFRDQYDADVSRFVQDIRADDRMQSHVASLVRDARNAAASRQHSTVTTLLAKVFAVWTLTSSRKTYNPDLHEATLFSPHPVQALAILRLLGVDRKTGVVQSFTKFFGFDSHTLQNHLVEIKTGEGKSITLGCCATVLALLDFDVDCGCFSQHLSRRDYAAFVEVFRIFGVVDRIRYAQLGDLVQQRLSRGNVTGLVQALFETDPAAGKQPTWPQIAAQGASRSAVLLIDEVDVFFSDSFYGNTYGQHCLFKSSAVTELIKYIWTKRSGVTISDVLASDAFKQVASALPSREEILQQCVREMISDVAEFDKPAHIVQNGRIGYKDQDSFNFDLDFRYRTQFLYLFEHERGAVDAKALENQLGLQIRSGTFSYAEMPLTYRHVLGVTGTLQDLGSFAEGIFEQYKVVKRTFAPSMYGEPKSSFVKESDDCKVLPDDSTWMQEIAQRALEAVQSKRAVLIFFQNLEKLKAFRTSQAQGLGTVNAVTEGDDVSVIGQHVKQSTRSKSITLFTRVFGRGTDFVTNDPEVLAAHGVMVIQTFLSLEVTEEVQHRGRTCRRGQEGAFRLIVSQTQLDTEFKAHATAAGVSEALTQRQLYKYLDDVRRKQFRDTFEARRSAVQDATVLHQQTLAFVDLLRTSSQKARLEAQHLRDLQTRLLAQLRLSGSSRGPIRAVFLLDVSGSMNENKKIDGAKKGIRTVVSFLEPTDRISFFTFGHSVVQKVLWDALGSECLPLESSTFGTKLNSVTCGGGTPLNECVMQVLRALRENAADGIPAEVVLLTDGADTGGGPVQGDVVTALRLCHRDSQPQVAAAGAGNRMPSFNFTILAVGLQPLEQQKLTEWQQDAPNVKIMTCGSDEAAIIASFRKVSERLQATSKAK